MQASTGTPDPMLYPPSTHNWGGDKKRRGRHRASQVPSADTNIYIRICSTAVRDRIHSSSSSSSKQQQSICRLAAPLSKLRNGLPTILMYIRAVRRRSVNIRT